MDVDLYPEFKAPADAAPAGVAEQAGPRARRGVASKSMRRLSAVAKLTPAELQSRNASGGSAVARFSVELLVKEHAFVVPCFAALAASAEVPALLNVAPVEKGEEL
eukprot:4650679-Pyramimonas_sp.AAC.1